MRFDDGTVVTIDKLVDWSLERVEIGEEGGGGMEAAAKEAGLKAQERRANPHLASVASAEAQAEAATNAKGADKGAVRAAERALELAAAKSREAVAVFDATRERAADAQKKARAEGVRPMADTVRGVILRVILCGIEQRHDIVEYAGSQVGSRK